MDGRQHAVQGAGEIAKKKTGLGVRATPPPIPDIFSTCLFDFRIEKKWREICLLRFPEKEERDCTPFFFLTFYLLVNLIVPIQDPDTH